MARAGSELQFKVLIEEDENGYFVADVPELPGCHTQGKTLEQVRERTKEAINLFLDVHPALRKEKIKSPRPRVTFFGVEDITIRNA